MRIMNAVGLCLAVAIFVTSTRSRAAQPQMTSDFEKSVVMLLSSKQTPDPDSPWGKGDVQTLSSLGVVIEGGYVLTTSWAVADSTLIELRRFGESQTVPMSVVAVDYEVNLALLKPKTASGLAGLSPLSLTGEMNEGSELKLLRKRDNVQLAVSLGRLFEVSMYRSATSNYYTATYLIKIQQSNLGWSEPLIFEGRLAALTTGQDDEYTYATPASVIQHFVKDAQSSNYRGFPSLGLQMRPLIDPNARKMLKVDKIKGGVRITKVTEDSPFLDDMRENDVLVKIGTIAIDDYGNYKHPLWGTIHFRHLINQLYAGDPVQVTVVRDGKTLIFNRQLKRYSSNNSLIPTYTYGKEGEFLIFGGFVFQELTRPFLTSWGKDWRSQAPVDLIYLYENEAFPTKNPEDRVVILGRVLADDFNQGYDSLKNLVVEKVNGESVTSLKRLAEILRTRPVTRSGKRYATFDFALGNGQAILGYDHLSESHQRIKERYGIPGSNNFYSDAID